MTVYIRIEWFVRIVKWLNEFQMQREGLWSWSTSHTVVDDVMAHLRIPIGRPGDWVTVSNHKFVSTSIVDLINMERAREILRCGLSRKQRRSIGNISRMSVILVISYGWRSFLLESRQFLCAFQRKIKAMYVKRLMGGPCEKRSKALESQWNLIEIRELLPLGNRKREIRV